MNYVFVFLGEFGFELFDWQGAVRKCAQTLLPTDRLICCSRANLFPLYEQADRYIDISEVPMFKQSIACMYWGRHSANERDRKFRKKHAIWDRKLKEKLRQHILAQEGQLTTLKQKTAYYLKRSAPNYQFVFSSDKTIFNKVRLGLHINASQAEMDAISIYSEAILKDNQYQKIEPVLAIKQQIEEKLQFSLDQPYILCQAANRDIIIRSQDIFSKEMLIKALSKQIPVILLNFDTGRYLDSISKFSSDSECLQYMCHSFPEQSCLIHFAKKCLFFTEGEFRSHIYVPPFLGKDVFVVAPKSVYTLKTSPLNFWNKKIFNFGGQIHAYAAEQVLASQQNLEQFIDVLLCQEVCATVCC